MASNPGVSTGAIVMTALMVTGNMVGAGILALPVNLGPSGLYPAIAGTVCMWLLMTTTAMIYSRQKALVEGEGADLPTFFGCELGRTGKWISVVANMVILYGLLTAYLAGVGSIVVNLFDLSIPEWAALLAYFIPATLLTSFGAEVMRRGNTLLMLCMWGAFAVLVALTVPHMSFARASMHDWGFFPSALPVLLTAFHFHNIIPTICRTLKQDRAAITKTIWLGTSLGLCMNIVWIVVVVCALPMSGSGANIINAFEANQPATVPLARVIGGSTFMDVALLFSIVAMTTSFMANGIALLSFIGDLASPLADRMRKVVVWPAAFLPPLFVGIVYPDIFLSALDVAGGVGINILFGILPGVLLIKYANGRAMHRWSGMVLVALFSIVLAIELGQEMGLLHISPDVEYWTAKH